MGGIVEIDETIYGRAATHPKGRGPFGSKLSNSPHKNVVLSLVERGRQVRSYHVAGSKRLTYQTARGTRPEAGNEPEARPF
jgi:hypothetical protein